jgi:hypothetical protein
LTGSERGERGALAVYIILAAGNSQASVLTWRDQEPAELLISTGFLL